MSQASAAPKAEPEAPATPATPATQTPTTSYTPTAWASSRSYQRLCIRVVYLTTPSHQKSPSILSYSNSLRMPRRLYISVRRFCSHPVLGRSITPNSSIPITHRRHMATINPISHPHKPRRLGQLRLLYSVSLHWRQVMTLLMLLPSMTR
jgi:hypothetical protein